MEDLEYYYVANLDDVHHVFEKYMMIKGFNVKITKIEEDEFIYFKIDNDIIRTLLFAGSDYITEDCLIDYFKYEIDKLGYLIVKPTNNECDDSILTPYLNGDWSGNCDIVMANRERYNYHEYKDIDGTMLSLIMYYHMIEAN